MLERIPAGFISTWEDLTTRFLAQFFLPGRTSKLRNDILMFQQHQGQSLSEVWNRFKDLLQKVPYHGIDLWLQIQIFYDHVNLIIRRTIDQAASGKLHDKNDEESWELLEDPALYDNKSWNNPRDFAKPVKDISMPHDVSSASDRRLIELENQVQRMMEAHLSQTKPVQVNKIASSCEICSGPHDTQYCMENPEQAFVDYASSRSNRVGGKPFATNQGPRTFNEAAHAWKDKPNFGWERAQTFTSPQRGSMSTYSSNTPYRSPTHSNNLEKMMNDFDSHQEKRLSSLRTQFQQQQDDISNKLNTLLKMCSERFNNNPAHNTTHANVLTSCQFEGTEPRNKEVIKSPTKLLALKYQEQPS
ncbi:MAK10-like protein [Tanacetum coccineum]